MTTAINGAMLAAGSSLGALIVVKVTIVAALGLAAAWLARRSRAAVRHALLAVTFGATLVLPIASIIAPRVHVTVPVAEVSPAAWPLVVNTPAQILLATAAADGARVAPAAPQQSTFSLSVLLLAGWIVGTAVFLVPVMTGLWQIRSLRRSGLPWLDGQSVAETLALDAGIHRRVEVLLHEALPGPITCGVLAPAIVLPRDAESWTREDLSRAIVHELEHVRRGDSATRCLARSVCALYWFHPLAWIAWRKLVLEAERSCDDAVLRRSEATVYADQLVGLAKRLPTAQRSPLLAMANRSDLATRVNAILDIQQSRGRLGANSVLLVCAVAAGLVGVISPLTVMAAPQDGFGATPTLKEAHLSFEVASVKPNKSDAPPYSNFPLNTGDPYVENGGHFVATNWPLVTYIFFAYKLMGNQGRPLLSQLPSWATTDRFDIEGRATGTPTKDQMRLMMQSLLAERFKLGLHTEKREIPVLALVLTKAGRTGPQLQPHDAAAPCQPNANPAPGDRIPNTIQQIVAGQMPGLCNVILGLPPSVAGRSRLAGRNVTIGFMADMFSQRVDRGRPMIDATGLPGKFDFVLEFTPEGPTSATAGANAEPQSEGPTFEEALNDQLGLKAESRKSLMDVIVLDRVERPSEN
jgi:bla regulator protein BlaR1